MYFTYNLPYMQSEVVLLLGHAKWYNYKHKTSKNDKKSLPTICLMAYKESAITYNQGLTNEFIHKCF